MFPFSFYLLCVVFCSRANGITTKSLPLILDNSSDTSQFVQIRSAINQPTRTFLVQHKSALSPAQQTHILDDVQKAQRIHYHPPLNDNGGVDGQIKSFFGNNGATSSLPVSNSNPNLNPNPNLFVSYPQTSFALNALSPPPVQTVVLSPQQTLPTSPSNVNEYYTPYRPSSQAELSNAVNSFTHGHGHGHGHANVNSAFEPNAPHGSGHKVYFPPATASTAAVQQTVDNLVTKISEQNFNAVRYTTPTPTPTFAKPETAGKSYLTKDPSSVFAPLIEKPKEPTTSEKLIKEVYLKMNPQVLIAKDRQKFFQQLLEDSRNDDEYVESTDDQTVAQNDLSGIRNQFEKEFMRQLEENAVSAPVPVDAAALANLSGVSEFSLPNGQKVQISRDYNRLLQEEDSGNKIKAIVVKQLPSSAGPKSNILEELTKGVVPPGAEFEVIKRNRDGGLEEVSKLPQNIPQKKVTFVILEEQSDGTVKVQGVRGSEKESLKESGDEVDTIIRKIKEGELKLPPSTRLSPKQSQKSADNVANKKNNLRGSGGGGGGGQNDSKSKRKSATADENRPPKRKEQQSAEKHFVPTPIVQAYTTPETTKADTYATTPEEDANAYQYFSSPSTLFADNKYAGTGSNYVSSTPSYDDNPTIFNHLAGESWDTADSPLPESATPKISDNLGLFHLNNSGYIASLFSALKTPSFTFDSLPAKTNLFQFPLLPTTLGNRVLEQSRRNATKVAAIDGDNSPYGDVSAATAAYEEKKENFYKKRDRNATRKTNKKLIKETRRDNDEEESNVEETKSDHFTAGENYTLSEVLKKEGFYAMARFLRQSGLDSILNDTGPFTLFIPTDKAFRTLLIQLGGPDKAEEKFKENPRLLSGLLLHHVIPGAFRITTLQDEMTGVSLAGTQLRVNTYTTHDIEWNDITVVTVNGAKILDEKDIVIPQGIAHAIDRVMFPLPVGNLLQSLQADRENRYSNFLKILEESELSYLLTGGKTFTLFAPLNRAFTHAEFTKILADSNESKSFVLRHLVAGALYSAGMKYYQVRDSMEDGQQITLYKEAGKIKVNNAHVVTRNIPATNGVIHAIDAFL